MADPVSLSLAIAPLLVEVIKGFRTLNSKLKVFRNYSREVARIQTRFSVQIDFFQSECEILIRKIPGDDVQASTLFKARQPEDVSRKLLEGLKEHLGRRFEAFESTFKDIQGSLQSLEVELRGFGEIDTERQAGETLREAVKRLKKRIKITVNQSAYDEALERLKESNFNLKNIRKHAEELNSQNLCVKGTTCASRRLPPELSALRRARLAAHAFYQAMNASWVCEEKKHQRHLLRLFMNTEAKEDIRMNILVVGGSQFQVKELTSATINGSQTGEEGVYRGETLGHDQPEVFSLEVRSSVLDYSAYPAALSESRVTKRQRVQWADHGVHRELDNSFDRQRATSSLKTNMKEYVVNLQPTSDIGRLRKVGCKTIADAFQSGDCLGYLDVQVQNCTYRNSFYRWPGQVCSQDLIPLADAPSIPQSLNELFNYPIHEYYDIRDQLELAKSMVSVVLKFHSTPWLDHWWTLKDIGYLNASNKMIDVLNTLYLGAVLGCSPRLDLPEACQKEQNPRPGIKNAALYNLGVALLQIDRWKDLDPNAAADIDKLSVWSRFGPKYRDIVQRCLHCNFGVDYDLTKPKLQTAVLDKVMGELDSMLSGLMIDDDDDER
ncbi:hypothetical protein Hte_009243 [Hypoxylon texense]